jgi:hypothetical protein
MPLLRQAERNHAVAAHGNSMPLRYFTAHYLTVALRDGTTPHQAIAPTLWQEGPSRTQQQEGQEASPAAPEVPGSG